MRSERRKTVKSIIEKNQNGVINKSQAKNEVMRLISEDRGVQPFTPKCEKCGVIFPANVDGVKLCMACQIQKDMKLDSDTIINNSIVDLWRYGRFDKVLGLEQFDKVVAEGILLLGDIDDSKRSHLTRLKTKSVSKSDREISGYIKGLMYRTKGSYDALVIYRFSKKSDYSVVAITYSTRVLKKLNKKTVKEKKILTFKLVVGNELKKIQNKSRKA